MTHSVVPRSFASAMPCSSAARPNGSALYPTTIVMPRLLLAPVLARSSLRSSLVVVFGSCLRCLLFLVGVVLDDEERFFRTVQQPQYQRRQQEHCHQHVNDDR